MEWLKSPYYVRPDPVFVNVGQTGNYPPSRQPMAETMMQDLTAQFLGWPAGFVFGAAGSGNRTPKQLLDDILAYAVALTQSQYSAVTCADFDPTSRAVFYAGLIFDTLKGIPAGSWLPNDARSVYDVWTAPK